MSFEIISCDIIRTTEAAVLISTGDEQHWVPKSLIDNLDEIDEFNDKCIDLEIANWFCEQELIY